MHVEREQDLERAIALGEHVVHVVLELVALLLVVDRAHVAEAEMRIDRHAITRLAAEQAPHRQPHRLPKMSHSACSMPAIAERPITPSFQKPCLVIVRTAFSMSRGSWPMTSGARSSTQPTTARVFHSSVASPQPWRPWSVSTFTNTQLRISALTTSVRMAVIFMRMPSRRGKSSSVRFRMRNLTLDRFLEGGRVVAEGDAVHEQVVTAELVDGGAAEIADRAVDLVLGQADEM